ncbi:hypothetical protein LOTGIDRAFT_152807 [Lottia gigantea]|uniref:Uncharacterized protein n=1 Tax=Lottia gigantea TaxID=225164 RepID=V4C7N6_LOTGI|nr:hypothetical protein LOTGIDRAFT_152807 [Lottia gigantea]ESO97714.1 hypothetical protein LOTGIDRAFT_152807 [Lottia gigantea]
MAVLFKKALIDLGTKQVSVVSNKESNVYDCCSLYWLPLHEKMWTGEVEFRFIKNWAEDVELNFTEDLGNSGGDKRNNTLLDISTTRSSRVERSCARKENWDNELFPDYLFKYNETWEGELFSTQYMESFRESWEGDFYSDFYIMSFEF